MTSIFVHHRLTTEPRQWQAVADHLCRIGAAQLTSTGALLYGIWRSQIGRPRDELTVLTAWPDLERAKTAAATLLSGAEAIRNCEDEVMVPVLRGEAADYPRRQGNYAFRWFETPEAHWDEFLDLCTGAWPGFEASYDSQVLGLWGGLEATGDLKRSLLLTRRPNLAMWERSKIPEGDEEAEVRRKLSRRYDLCDWTCVYTTTLLTAADKDDSVRWA